MKQILFVDDEPMLLDGLKRSLRSMRNEWVMTFVGSGEEALKVLRQVSFDVIVSDMHMPKMDGIQLLNEVQRCYPHVVRILLSGYFDKAMIGDSIRATHQFLAKPCEPEQVKATIQRACALQDVLRNKTLRAIVSGLPTIPSLPTILLEIKQEAESERSSLKTIGQIIAKDMGMTAKILQLANSAFFGVRGPISSVERAVNFLGLETIQGADSGHPCLFATLRERFITFTDGSTVGRELEKQGPLLEKLPRQKVVRHWKRSKPIQQGYSMMWECFDWRQTSPTNTVRYSWMPQPGEDAPFGKPSSRYLK